LPFNVRVVAAKRVVSQTVGMDDQRRDTDRERDLVKDLDDLDDLDTIGEQRHHVADVAFAASLLRAAAVLALAFWVVSVAASAWLQWTQFDSFNQGLELERPRLVAVVAAATATTWGYLLVAVVAYAAAMALPGSRVPAQDAFPGDDEVHGTRSSSSTTA